MDTRENLKTVNNDNDLSAYVKIINRNAGYNDLDNLRMNVKYLKSANLFNLADPFLLFAMYSMLKTYLWDGGGSTNLPAIKISGINYLPALRTGLTPFGLEYHLENYLCFNDKSALLDLSIGDTKFHSNWGGAGLNLRNIYSGENFSVDVNLNAWHQPGLESGANPSVIKGIGWGGAVSLRGYYGLADSPVAAVLELGYKSAGFVEGYEMGASPIIIAGLAVRY